MAIRIRNINGHIVALCAAKTQAMPGDLYLDDGVHHALTTKFAVDFKSEGFLIADLADDLIKKEMLSEEK